MFDRFLEFGRIASDSRKISQNFGGTLIRPDTIRLSDLITFVPLEKTEPLYGGHFHIVDTFQKCNTCPL
jgi:hypothetical protein